MDNKIKVEKTCYLCHEKRTIEMTKEEYENLERYLQGEGLIQELLPNITPPDRELLKGGMCGNCWKKIFGESPLEID